MKCAPIEEARAEGAPFYFQRLPQLDQGCQIKRAEPTNLASKVSPVQLLTFVSVNSMARTRAARVKTNVIQACIVHLITILEQVGDCADQSLQAAGGLED